MALALDTIRSTADRVASSHGLEIVEIEFSGGAKHRTLRVFLEKDAAGRAQLAAAAATPAEDAQPTRLPAGVPVEQLSGVTLEDCENFARDFGTVLDVEDLVPGAEYSLEVSSPGLERRLLRPADYVRFLGSLAKVQTFTAIGQTRHFQGRLTACDGVVLTLDPAAIKQKGKGRRIAVADMVEIPLANVEKASLIAEF